MGGVMEEAKKLIYEKVVKTFTVRDVLKLKNFK